MTKFEEIIRGIKYLEEYEKKKLSIILIAQTLNPKEVDRTINVMQSNNKKGMI